MKNCTSKRFARITNTEMVYQHPQLVKDPLVSNDFPLWLRPSLFCVLQVSVIDIEKEIKFRKIMKIIVFIHIR